MPVEYGVEGDARGKSRADLERLAKEINRRQLMIEQAERKRLQEEARKQNAQLNGR